MRASGLVIRDLPLLASSWRKQQTLDEFLREYNAVAISQAWISLCLLCALNIHYTNTLNGTARNLRPKGKILSPS